MVDSRLRPPRSGGWQTDWPYSPYQKDKFGIGDDPGHDGAEQHEAEQDDPESVVRVDFPNRQTGHRTDIRPAGLLIYIAEIGQEEGRHQQDGFHGTVFLTQYKQSQPYKER